LIEQFLKEIEVHDCPGLTKVRLGNEHDGGYVVLNEPLDLVPVLYSFGVGNDVGFEIDFVKRFPEARVELFDPTIQGLPENHGQFRFHKKGIPAHGNQGWGEIPHNSLLKIDVEGAEWKSIASMAPEILSAFSQMVVEFHILHVEPRNGLSPYFHGLYSSLTARINTGLFSKYQKTLAKINVVFWCYHIHANNSLPLATLAGYTFPPLLEMSFIRKDLAGEVRPAVDNFLVPGLDAPNKTDRPDIGSFYPFRRIHAE
jgi:hypothetical protein